MPSGDDAATWTVDLEGADPEREAARSAMLALADGVIGAPAALPGADGGRPAVAAGVYAGTGPETALVPLPTWNRPPADDAGVRRRTLDLRDGTLRSELATPDGDVSLLAFAALARPGTGVLAAEGPAPALPTGDRAWQSVHGEGRVAVAGVERAARLAAGRARLERLVAHVTDPRQPVRPEAAAEALAAAERLGVEQLLAEQRTAWARRWAATDIRIDGDAELQRAVRFCLFHLMASVAERTEAALGAKGLSGAGYRGHVFWDSDVFVLPFLAATHPPAARALVGYRTARLDAARAAARRLGFAGARFPWESAGSGDDVTPRRLPDAHGELVDVLTGEQEEHITADVAWAVGRYQGWSGDRRTAGAVRELVQETARYWASRIAVDSAGSAHLDAVIGPDEYHEGVDDNAFTNAMARWNLEHAAALAAPGDAEAARWRELARALVDGYDPQLRRHEQFAGYFDLEPLTVADLPADRNPVDALGWERLQRTQLLKQADVLMLHLLVPELAGPDALDHDIDWYEPRTTHASSLSRPVHAAALARAGRVDRALDYLRYSSTIDLEDRGGRTAEGLHVATMGGVWHALVHGIAGLELDGGGLRLQPHLPPGWDALELQVLVHEVPFRIRVLPDRVHVQAAGRRSVCIGRDAERVEVDAGGVVVEHDATAWRAA